MYSPFLFIFVLTMATKTATSEYYCFDSLNSHFKYWTFLGVTSKEFSKPHQRTLYRIHSTLMILAVQIYFPLHIVFGLFQLSNPQDLLEAIPLALAMVLCAMNVYFLRGALSVLEDIKEKSKAFEQKARADEEEFAFILEFKSKSKMIMKFYLTMFTNLSAFAVISLFTYDSRRLFIPGYFPYDFWSSCWVNICKLWIWEYIGLDSTLRSQKLIIINSWWKLSKITYKYLNVQKKLTTRFPRPCLLCSYHHLSTLCPMWSCFS